jgi:hypothetical protein
LKPATQAPKTAPRVLNPYKKERCPPRFLGCSERNFDNTGRVPPIRVVEMIKATTEKRTRMNKRERERERERGILFPLGQIDINGGVDLHQGYENCGKKGYPDFKYSV